MQSQAQTVAEYLRELPDDRRKAIKAIRKAIKEHLPAGYREGMQYGMIGYFVPHTRYPPGYHCDPAQPLPFASIGNQKRHIGLYMTCLYQDPKHLVWFRKAWAAAGHKLDMGKACVRVASLDDVPLDVVGQAVARVPVDAFIANYEAQLDASGIKHKGIKATRAPAKKTTKKAAKMTAKKSAKKTSKAPMKSGARVVKKSAKKVVRKSASARKNST